MSSGNCYSSGPIPLLPDSTTPGLYPRPTQGTPPPASVVLPGEGIRQLVGDCYGPDIGLTPDGNVPGQYPRPTQGVPAAAPTIDPGEVIRDIVARCYPGLPVIDQPTEDIPDWNDVIDTGPWPFDWMCQLFPDLPVCGLNPPTILPPFPWNPVGPYVGDGKDCERIMEGLAATPPTVRKHEDPREDDKYVVIATGEYLYCKIDNHVKNPDWENCVNDALDCIFKPYVTGTWKTPAADCDTTFFRGQNSTSNQICVSNCVPDRVAVYEYYNGTDHAYGLEASAPVGYNRTSTEASFYILPDRGAKTVPLYKYYSTSTTDTFLTTNPGQPDSPGAGERATMNAAGMGFGTTFGHVFLKPDDAKPYLTDGEEMVPLHRYYSAGLGDHLYSLSLMAPEQAPEYLPKQLVYKIPLNPQSDIVIGYKVRQGEAGYSNTWGYYIGDSNGIAYNKVILGNVKQNISYQEITIPKATLQLYAGRPLGFFIVPNGANFGCTDGAYLSMYASGGGFKHSGGSSEQGYIFFSDRRMNPGNRSKTRWVGNNWQWWEDLLNGDDDYDDVKVRYELRTTGFSYDYEGVQCYVFPNLNPPKTYMPITPKDKCATLNFNGTFSPSVVTRTACGGYNTFAQGTEGQSAGTGNCQGGYATEINRTQSIKAYKTAQYQLKAYGAITTSVESGALRFRVLLKKNGSNVVNYTSELDSWPTVGSDIGNPFTLEPDDELEFSLDEIEAGPQSGTGTVTLILYNVTEGTFENPWSTTIGTSAEDADVTGRTEVVSDNPSGGGSIKKISIQLWDQSEQDWSAKVYVWDNGAQLNTNGANGQSATWNNTYYSGAYYEGGQRNGTILSATIDEDGAVSTPTDDRGIFYNQLFDHGRGLICKPANPLGNLLRDFNHHSVGVGFTSWFLNETTTNDLAALSTIDGWYARGINGQSGGQYSKMSFFHDYTLGVFGNEETQTSVKPSGKVRIAFWPYTVSIDGDHDRWGCGVELFDLINGGTSYTEGDSFVLEWPTKQPKKDSYQDLGTSVTPYWPRDDSSFSFPNEVDLSRRGESGSETYTPRYAFYQESHNRDSNIWYVSQYKMKPIRFRINIEEVN